MIAGQLVEEPALADRGQALLVLGEAPGQQLGQPGIDRGQPGALAGADRRTQRGLEEIEHRSVAFDVLQKVNPSYWLRVAGLAVATTTLAGFWAWGAVMLLRQDEARRSASRYFGRTGRPPIIRTVFLRGIRAYIRRGFHPKDAPLDHLAAAWMSVNLPSQEPIAKSSSAA